MALKSTIFKLNLNVADLDHHVYEDFNLTIAQHPSETGQRMMLRVLAFALHAGPTLEFGRGISTEGEPDLWQKSLSDTIELWIELGTPDPDRLRKACSRADKVLLYCYGDRATPVWWRKNQAELARFDNLTILQVSDSDCDALADMAIPGMSLQCTISEGDAMFTVQQKAISIRPTLLKD